MSGSDYHCLELETGYVARGGSTICVLWS